MKILLKTAAKGKISHFFAALFIAFMSLSCATNRSAFLAIDMAVGQADFKGAIEAIREGQEKRNPLYDSRNAISLYLDKGLLEHYAGNYENSSADLQNAERLIEEAYTKSIMQNFLSYIINDNVKDYPGEDFEDIYINVFNALNYYHRGDMEGALVEIRKLSQSSGKLDMLSRRYEYYDPNTGASLTEMAQRETGVREMPAAGTTSFSNSALARYLGALFYQGIGNYDAARIEFDQVYRAFETNKAVYRFPVPAAVEQARNVPQGQARLNIISFAGLSPVKEETVVTHYLPFSNPVLRVAMFRLPALVHRPSIITRIEVIVIGGKSGAGTQRFNLELLEDMNAVIEDTYNLRYSNTLLKTYIRTIIKYAVADVTASAAARRLDNLSGFMVALTARAGMDVSESADIRMSRYLPGRAFIGGINLDPGLYSVIINYYSGNNLISGTSYQNVNVGLNRLNLLQSVNLR